jgi:antagonist of KipI
MSVAVIRQGVLDTIQDEGRFGFQHLGINANGSMDLSAACIANMLVRNKTSEAVIELHFPAASFLFKKSCLIALNRRRFFSDY